MESNENEITAEQYNELQRQLEETKKAQAGSDRTVQELKAQLEAERSGKQDETEKSKQQQVLLNRKQRVFEKSLEMGRDPKYDVSLLFGDMDDEEKLEYLDQRENELVYKEREDFVKKNGRRPADININSIPAPGWDDILKMSDQQIKDLPDSTIENAKNTKKAEQKLTMRDRLKGNK